MEPEELVFRFEPPDQTVTGTIVTVDMVLDGVPPPGLGSFKVVVDYDETIAEFISVVPSAAVTGIPGFIDCPLADNPDLGVPFGFVVRLECNIATGGTAPTGTVTLGTMTVDTFVPVGFTPLTYVETKLIDKGGTCVHDSTGAACAPNALFEVGAITVTTGASMLKDPNVANLWLCEGPTCTNNGEGVLVIDEVVLIAGGDPDGIGAYEFHVKFDHKVFDILVEDASWLSNGGTRTVDCSMSIINENSILFGCVSSGPTPGQEAGGVAATLTVLPEADMKFRLTPGQNNGVVRTILDQNCELADVFGDPLADEAGDPLDGILPGGLLETCADATITVRILEGDLNLDCVVDVLDDQMIAYRYGAFFGNLLYDPWYDLEPALKDFDVDIKDLQKVFGRNRSTCEDPVPLQPPLAP